MNKTINKTILSIIGILILAVLVLGCQKASEKATGLSIEKQIEAESGQDVDVDINGNQMTMKTDDGTVKVETNMVGEDDWCPEGGEWKMAAQTDDGNVNAQWKIDKIVASGEYKGLCHVVYATQTPNGEMKMDYWFDESKENGFYEIDMNGKKMKYDLEGNMV